MFAAPTRRAVAAVRRQVRRCSAIRCSLIAVSAATARIARANSRSPLDVEHHARVAGAAPSVDIDESSLQIGQLRDALLLESVESCGGLGKRGLRLRHSGVRGLFLFSSNVSLEFELPEIPNQRSSLGREPIGFRLQCSHAIVDAPCHRVRRGAVLSE